MVGSVSPGGGCQALSNPSTAGSQANRFPHECPVQRGRFPPAHSFTENRIISRVGESAVHLTVHRTKGLGFCFCISPYATPVANYPHISRPKEQESANLFYEGLDSKGFHL